MKGRIMRNEPINRISLPIIGKIKVGVKDEKGLPKSIDYFVSTGKYAGLFKKAYGEKPQTIQIVFAYDEPEKSCREEYQYRDDAGKVVAYGDGETFFVWNGKQYCQYSTKDYPDLMAGVAQKRPNRAVKNGGDGWIVTLTVTFIIPLVRGVAGVWQFATKGTASTIPQIRETFDGMLEERGFCKGIIFDLNVQFATTQKPGDRSRFPVVSLVPNESADNVLKMRKAWEPAKQLDNE